MNKPTTNSYFPFFGVPYHLILHGKISGLGRYGLECFFFWGGGWGGVIFGNRIFRFRRETDKSVMVKLQGEKKKMRLSPHSMAYL